MPTNSQYFELANQFKLLVKLMTLEWNKRMVSNMTMSQYRMLHRLHVKGPQKVSELAEFMDITSGGVTGVTDKLMVNGYVDRKRDEEDRRVVYIEITDKGKDMVQLMKERQGETISAFFETLPEEDLNHLNRIFTHVIDHIKED
jgi:DNA-binding MarR family transcriptional regulator